MCDDSKPSCDFTKPVADFKNAFPAPANAQYFLTGKKLNKSGGHDAPVNIGEGLDLKTARALSEYLSNLTNDFYPGHFFNCPFFGIDLRLPTYVKNGSANVGDLILRQFRTEPEAAAGGCKVFIDTFIVGQVADVEEDESLIVTDRTGTSKLKEKPYFIFDAGQFDMKSAIADLSARDEQFRISGFFGELHGSFENLNALAHAIRKHLKPSSAKLPSNDDASNIMGYPVDMKNFLQKWKNPSESLMG